MSDRNRATHFSRIQGGKLQSIDFDIYEDELHVYKDLTEKKEVFSKEFKKKLVTRVVKFGKVYVHALFFENGAIYDVDKYGFRKRESKNIQELLGKLVEENV